MNSKHSKAIRPEVMEYQRLLLYCKRKKYYTAARAITFAMIVHFGQTRKNEEPFILHSFRVVKECILLGSCTERLICLAALHDVCEECGIVPEDLPFAEDIRHGVALLTLSYGQDRTAFGKKYTKMLYFLSQLGDPEVLACKAMDRADNLKSLHELSDIAAGKNIDETRFDLLPVMYAAIQRCLSPDESDDYRRFYGLLSDAYCQLKALNDILALSYEAEIEQYYESVLCENASEHSGGCFIGAVNRRSKRSQDPEAGSASAAKEYRKRGRNHHHILYGEKAWKRRSKWGRLLRKLFYGRIDRGLHIGLHRAVRGVPKNELDLLPSAKAIEELYRICDDYREFIKRRHTAGKIRWLLGVIAILEPKYEYLETVAIPKPKYENEFGWLKENLTAQLAFLESRYGEPGSPYFMRKNKTQT